jgi:hypothetical protein
MFCHCDNVFKLLSGLAHPILLCEVPFEVHSFRTNRHRNVPDLHEHSEQEDRFLVTAQHGRYPHIDGGVKVRRVFYNLHSIAKERLY